MPKVPDTQENRDKCVCPKCPTFKGSDCPKEKNELLYCSTGLTDCGLADRGCICGTCPLWEEYKLAKGLFCLNGAME